MYIYLSGRQTVKNRQQQETKHVNCSTLSALDVRKIRRGKNGSQVLVLLSVEKTRKSQTTCC